MKKAQQVKRRERAMAWLRRLLVVIILGLLTVLLLPWSGLRWVGGHGHHRVWNEVANLKNAIKQYEYDYQELPLPMTSKGMDYCRMESDEWLMAILMGRANGEKLNPRGSRYYEGIDSREGVNGLLWSGAEPNERVRLVDAWGRMYQIVIDADGDGYAMLPDGTRVEGGVAVYSLGEDGVFDAKRDPVSW